MNKHLVKVCNLIEDAKNKYPEHGLLERNGDIQYCNGNDGTDFDWEVNKRLCEFGCGLEEKAVWAFKCYIYRNGEAEVLCYPNGEMSPVEVIKCEKFLSKDKVKELYEHMLLNYDYKGIFDAFVVDIEED